MNCYRSILNEGESMKGIVIEELKDKFIVLIDDGDFIEIDKLSEKVEIGNEIVIVKEKNNIKKIFKCFVLIVVVFCMVVFGYVFYCFLVI